MGEMNRKKQNRRARLILIAAVCAALVIAAVIVYAISEKRRTEYERSEQAWQLYNYKLMDEMYDAGKYDALCDCFYEALRDDHEVSDYRHAAFCTYYFRIRRVTDNVRSKDGGGDLASLLFDEASLYSLDGPDMKLSDDERETLELLRAPLIEDMIRRFSLTAEEIETIRSAVLRSGYYEYAECKRLVKEKGL